MEKEGGELKMWRGGEGKGLEMVGWMSRLGHGSIVKLFID